MSYDRVGVKKLRDNPEAFVIFWVHETGTAFYQWPNDFTEAGVHAGLGSIGCPQQGTEACLASARKTFELKHSRWKF